MTARVLLSACLASLILWALIIGAAGVVVVVVTVVKAVLS
jgi:hypothetical protein